MKYNQLPGIDACCTPCLPRSDISRRSFLRAASNAAAIGAAGKILTTSRCSAETTDHSHQSKMRFGLVTYTWGADWDLPTLLSNCEKAKAFGVELRTTHAHRVEPNISAERRREVKQRFADSPVT